MEKLETKVDDIVKEVRMKMFQIDYDTYPEEEDKYIALEKAKTHLEEAQWIFNCLK